MSRNSDDSDSDVRECPGCGEPATHVGRCLLCTDAEIDLWVACLHEIAARCTPFNVHAE
jgi:hypothetical protein